MVHGPTRAGSGSPSLIIATAQPSSSSFLITRAVQPLSRQRRSSWMAAALSLAGSSFERIMALMLAWRSRCRAGRNPDARPVPRVLFAIDLAGRASAVDDEEVGFGAEGEQRMVPGAWRVVDALGAGAKEAAQRGQLGHVTCGRDDDEPG